MTKSDAMNTLKENDANISEIKKMEKRSNRSTIINAYTDLVKCFGSYYFGKVHDEAEDKADNEKLDTTDLPDLESDKSAKQGRKQNGQGVKILTPKQMLTRLSIVDYISLAQLGARNNSEKLKNEIRQPLYLLYRSKKLSKTIYNSLINTF